MVEIANNYMYCRQDVPWCVFVHTALCSVVCQDVSFLVTTSLHSAVSHDIPVVFFEVRLHRGINVCITKLIILFPFFLLTVMLLARWGWIPHYHKSIVPIQR